MKRDMDLVRKLLLAIEKTPHGFPPENFTVEDYSNEQIAYHCYIMGQAELIEVTVTTNMKSDSPEAIPRNLTWYGHEFLDAAREQTRWDKAKSVVEKVGGASIPVWKDILTDLIKKAVGL